MLTRLGAGEIAIIIAVAFLIFGPQKLPEISRGFGEALRNFKDALEEPQEMKKEREEE